MREINKISSDSRCFLSIQNNRFSQRRALTKTNPFTLFLNSHLEATPMNGYSFMSSRTVRAGALIVVILAASSRAEIFAAVIQSIVIFVIAFSVISVLQIKNLAMHFYLRLFLGRIGMGHISGSIEALTSIVPLRKPFPLAEPFIISGINNSNLSLGKRNFLVRWDSGHPQNSILGGLGRMVAHPMPHYSLRGVSQ